MKKRMFMKFLFVVGFALPGVGLWSSATYAETATDPAPEIQPAQPNNQKILFDNTHAQTAGAADWVIDGGFSDFANSLANQGFYVKELRKTTPITYDDLKDYDVFVLPEANIPYKASEQKAIADYVSNGGSVLYISDHYNADRNKNRIDSSEAFNGYRRGAYTDITKGMSDAEKNSAQMSGVESSDWLSTTFGVRFRYNAIDNLSSFSGQTMEDAFGILSGVNSVAIHAGSTIAITDPTVAKGLIYLPALTSANKWGPAVDQGVYNNGGIEEGAYVAISKRGNGKAAFIGDSSLVEDASPKYRNEETGRVKTTYDGYKEQDDSVLLKNLVTWLSQEESYQNFQEVGIPLSQKTALYDFEKPELSTEPQAEPWATPQVQYKWYDSTTFAAGSFGSAEKAAAQPEYQIEFPQQIVAGQENQATIKFSKLASNTTVSGFDFGVYTPTAQNGFSTGAQVAQTKIGNEAWKTTLGYSNKFAVQTDATGSATQAITFKVEKTGSYNFRIRGNGSAVKTISISVTDAKPIAKSVDYDVTGSITFEENTDIVNPTDPENPGKEVTPINPDGSLPNTGTGGSLSIDYASQLNFGKQKIENKTRVYGALPQKYKDSEEVSANYVQVTDKRGLVSGWKLNILQTTPFKTADNEELRGAVLVLGNGKVNSSQIAEEGYLESMAPIHSVPKATVKENTIEGGTMLIPGSSSEILTANKGAGSGTWTLAYGNKADNTIGLDGDKNANQSSIYLSVPVTAQAKAKQYNTTIKYQLSSVPE